MNLFIGNLNPITKAEGLRILFSEFGEVVSSKVIFDNMTGTSKGFGFVEMGDKNQAFDAIDNLDMSYFEGNIISVKEAKQNSTKPGGSGNAPRPSYNKPRTPRPGGYGGGYSGGGERNYNKL